MLCSALTTRLRAALVLLLPVLLVGCAALQTADEDEDPEAEEEPTEAPEGPGFAFIHETDDDAIALHDAIDDERETLFRDATYNGQYAAAPTGHHLAFTYTTADSVHLAWVDLESGAATTVDSRPDGTTYSLAWHPEASKLAYGYYAPVPEGERGDRGSGGIRVANDDGTTRSVQCQAAREVLHWIDDSSIAARDDENLFVVAADDCATQSSADARRMHHHSYAPVGDRHAFIHRDLSYDQSAGEYRPDSSLHVSDAQGQNAEELFGDERRARHLSWSPDRPELAFDARDEDADRRHVLIYNAERDQTSFLIPPDEAPDGDEIQPRWSPSGSHLAFTLREGESLTAAVRVDGQTRRLGSISKPVWGWVTDQALVMRDETTWRVQTTDNQTAYEFESDGRLIYAWEQPAV